MDPGKFPNSTDAGTYRLPRIILEAGATPPSAHVVARGGSKPVPLNSEPFSASVGETQFEAAAGVPHGHVRFSTVGAIVSAGGTVRVAPEPTKEGNTNFQHVNVQLIGLNPFGELQESPVPKVQRIR